MISKLLAGEMCFTPPEFPADLQRHGARVSVSPNGDLYIDLSVSAIPVHDWDPSALVPPFFTCPPGDTNSTGG